MSHRDDPPDCTEVPECCDEMMDVMEDGSCVCTLCGKTIDPDFDQYPESIFEQYEPEHYTLDCCKHGNEWGDCDKCDHESDQAYDAERERRWNK